MGPFKSLPEPSAQANVATSHGNNVASILANRPVTSPKRVGQRSSSTVGLVSRREPSLKWCEASSHPEWVVGVEELRPGKRRESRTWVLSVFFAEGGIRVK